MGLPVVEVWFPQSRVLGTLRAGGQGTGVLHLGAEFWDGLCRHLSPPLPLSRPSAALVSGVSKWVLPLGAVAVAPVHPWRLITHPVLCLQPWTEWRVAILQMRKVEAEPWHGLL